jgi:hypothetical protein
MADRLLYGFGTPDTLAADETAAISDNCSGLQPSRLPRTAQIGASESINSNAANGAAFARALSGDLAETTPAPRTSDIPCFARGQRISKDRRCLPIEDLGTGALILTKDNGFVLLMPLRNRFVGCMAIAQVPWPAPCRPSD